MSRRHEFTPRRRDNTGQHTTTRGGTRPRSYFTDNAATRLGRGRRKKWALPYARGGDGISDVFRWPSRAPPVLTDVSCVIKTWRRVGRGRFRLQNRLVSRRLNSRFTIGANACAHRSVVSVFGNLPVLTVLCSCEIAVVCLHSRYDSKFFQRI